MNCLNVFAKVNRNSKKGKAERKAQAHKKRKLNDIYLADKTEESPGSSTAKSRMKSKVLIKASFSSENLFKDSRFWFRGELLQHEDDKENHNAILGFDTADINIPIDLKKNNKTNWRRKNIKEAFILIGLNVSSINQIVDCSQKNSGGIYTAKKYIKLLRA